MDSKRHDYIPDYIFDSAWALGDWMEQNCPDGQWCFDKVASRRWLDRLHARIAELEPERDRLRTALYGVRAIIMSVPVNLGKRWPLRDEILYQIDPALTRTDTEDE